MMSSRVSSERVYYLFYETTLYLKLPHHILILYTIYIVPQKKKQKNRI